MVNENKYTRNKEQKTNVYSKGDNDVVGELLEIDELHHRFQKLTEQPQKFQLTQNRDGLDLTNNVKDKNTNVQTNKSSKVNITTNRDRSDNDINTPFDIYKRIVIFDDSILMGIDIWNLNARLSTPNCKCCFFGGATPKKPLYSANLNEGNVMTDIAVLHMGTNGINNIEVDKDHIIKCVIDIAKECV